MTHRPSRHALTLALLACATGASAAPFTPFDVRAAGMGGTGVASAKSASAALFNPAMLSAQKEGDAFQFVLGAGATVADEAEMFDEIDALQGSIEDFDNAGSDADLYAAAAGINRSLRAIDDQYLLADLGTGLGVGVPGKALGVGVFVTGKAFALATPAVAASDVDFIQDVIDDYEADNDIDTPPGDFPAASEATGLAVAVFEYGVALSREITISNGILQLGVTPKMIEVSTFQYTANVDNFDEGEIDSSDHETSDSGFDLDAGLVYRTAADSPWQFGLVAKNLVGSDYDTEPNVGAPTTIELSTQVRAGAAYVLERASFAVDLDLVENDGIADGAETQFLALGAEYDLKYVQFRAGYRANLASSAVEDVASVGLGLGPLDLAAVANGDEMGAYLQFGFGW